jgi:hypothetical protein
MLEQELKHLDAFEKLMVERRARRRCCSPSGMSRAAWGRPQR